MSKAKPITIFALLLIACIALPLYAPHGAAPVAIAVGICGVGVCFFGIGEVLAR